MRLSGPSPCPRAQGQASDRACAAPATSSSTPWANRPMRRPSCEKAEELDRGDRKSTRLNSSHLVISYAVFCLKKKKNVISECITSECRVCARSHHRNRLV